MAQQQHSISIQTITFVFGLLLNLAVMVGWFTAIEHRLTKLETKQEIMIQLQGDEIRSGSTYPGREREPRFSNPESN